MKLPSRPKRWINYIQLGLVIVVGVLVGVFLQVVPIGYVLVGAYCLAALVKRIPSRITFGLALGTLVLSPVGIAIGQASVANGFSLFGFLLLSVGVVTLVIELIRERR